MKLIISPAKKMNQTDCLPWKDLPAFMEETVVLKEFLQGLTYSEAKALWKCNDKLAELNYERFRHMNLQGNLSPAILSYEGIQYQYMAPEVLEQQALDWMQENLRILSGFYGILRPFDGIVPYRLEMQAKAVVGNYKDLYHFWGEKLYRNITEEDHVILNLASKEYSKCIESYLSEEDTFITCVFAELAGDKILQKGTLAKMARGEMVRFLAEQQAKKPEEAQAFDRLGFTFCPERSEPNEYVFIKSNPEQVKKDDEQS